jgi:hypothetical protein
MKKVLFFLFAAAMMQFAAAQTVDEANEALGYETQTTVSPMFTTTSGNTSESIPAGGLILILESTNKRVMSFDPTTGNLINASFLSDPTHLTTPIEVLQTHDKQFLLVSDQVSDAIFKYDLDGNFIEQFAPLPGGPTLDNLRGMEVAPNGHVLVTSGATTNKVVHEFDEAGNYVGVFIATGVGGLQDPFDIYYRESQNDYLVACIGLDEVLRYDINGNPLGALTSSPMQFPEQIAEAANSNILVSGFSSPSGAYEFTSAGGAVGYYSIITGLRGIYELPNNNLLVTNGTGVYEITRTNVNVGAKITGVSGRYISFVEPPTTNVTFRVDMSEQTVSPNGIHIAGSFQGWDPATSAMVDMGSGIYELTFALDPASHHNYKFINGNDWSGVETVPAACGEPDGFGGYNRYIDVPANDTILIAVCFGSCSVCNPPTVNVTFKVDMSNEVVNPAGVHVAGSFQGWNPGATIMSPIGSNVYAVTLPLPAGEYHEYKYINGDQWEQDESVPPACAVNNNRYITVPAQDTTMPALCFGSCDPCTIITYVDVTFRVDMSQQVVSPDGVHVAGSFQGWDPSATLMTDIGGGMYEVVITLVAGAYHEYKYINGNAWGQEETVPWYCANNNNRYINVPAVMGTILEVCFGSCNVCNPTPRDITFRVDMSQQIVPPEGVHIAGSFQGWDPATTPLTHVGNNIYEVTLTLGENDYHEYKFINGNAWGQDESVPGACNSNGNRYIWVPQGSTVLPAVCFGSCDPCPLINIPVDLKLFLEGPYNPATDLMETSLNAFGAIPLDQPFNVPLPFFGNPLPVWYYTGTESVVAIPNADVVDWMLLELRQGGISGTNMVARKPCFILNNGRITDLDGVSIPFFSLTNGNDLYAVVYQKNHQAVMSSSTLPNTSGVYYWDFTTGSGQYYGGINGAKELETGVWGARSGDGNADKQTNNNDKILVWKVQSGMSGYLEGDFNLDAQVNNPDKVEKWKPNSGTSSQVPN